MLQIDTEYDELMERIKSNQTHYWAKAYADEAVCTVAEDSDAVSTHAELPSDTCCPLGLVRNIQRADGRNAGHVGQ